MKRQSVLTILIVCLAMAAGTQLLAQVERQVPAPEVKGVESPGIVLTANATGGPDAFGYVYTDSTEPGGPAAGAFFDISATGTSVALADDAGATFPIGFSFSFYGTGYMMADVSSNGYVTFGPDATDFSNDCPLVEGGLTPPISIFTYWDDLDPGDDGALAYYEFFPVCPVGTATGCTIVQWEEFDNFPGDGVPGGSAGTFQAVLYDNGDILYQYEGGPDLTGGDATVGIWNSTLPESLLYTCDGGGISAGLAILFSLGAIGDLEITKTGDVVVGGSTDYTITVTNLGPEDQTGVVVTDVIPAEFTYVGDTCGGSEAGGTWTWNVGNLAASASDSCVLTLQLASSVCVEVSNTADVTGDLLDIPADNSSSTATNSGGGGGNQVADPSFEGGTPNPDWNETSTNFGTPLCTVGTCGTGTGTGPRTGDWWAWFGGIAAFEDGTVSQDVTIPMGADTLSFWLEAIVCDSAADFLEVTIDGSQVFLVDGSAPFCGVLGYHEETVDISAFADGGTHTLEFHSTIFAQNGGGTNFFVDDVAIDAPALPPICIDETGFDIEIPTLNVVGLVLLALLLAGGSLFVLRRRTNV